MQHHLSTNPPVTAMKRSWITTTLFVAALSLTTKAFMATVRRSHHLAHPRSRNSYHYEGLFLSSNPVDEKQLKYEYTPKTFQDFEANSFESGLSALQAYYKIHGDLVIPKSFIVPHTEHYPVEWHGAKLSRHIYNMKWWQKHIASNSERVAQLNKIEFIWGRLQPQWNIFMEGMSSYYRLYGDSKVPLSFVIPNGDPWRKECWGFPLGNVAYRIRSRNDFMVGHDAMSRRAQVDRLEFVWDFSEYNFMKFFIALKHYVRLEQGKVLQSTGSSRERIIRVPYKFVVPDGHDNGWPENLWGYPLGTKCMAVRQKSLYIKNDPIRKSRLEDIGFRFSGNTASGWLDVVHAAAIYSKIHGRFLDVPANFVVPSAPDGNYLDTDDVWPWPDHLSGLKLGQRLKDVRLKGTYLKGKDKHIRKAQLDTLGFVWNPKRGRRRRGLGDIAGRDSID